MITVTNVNLEEGSTIFTGVGVDEEGNTVTFGGDARMGWALHDALLDGEEPEVDPPAWAILSVQAP